MSFKVIKRGTNESKANLLAKLDNYQYIVKKCFSEIFQTRSDDITAACMYMFNCLPIARHRNNLLLKFTIF